MAFSKWIPRQIQGSPRVGTPSVSQWITSGNNLQTGSDYIKAIHVRGNLLYMTVRASRGRVGSAPLCEAGCNRPASLSHISQGCPKTHRFRVDRHDSIVDLVADRSTKAGFKVLKEPRIPTSVGLRVPDLILSKDGATVITDVIIASDAYPMESYFAQKISYYSEQSILDWVEKHVGGEVQVSAIVLNWRGAMYEKSAKHLKAIGIRESTLEVMSCRVLSYTANMVRHYHTCTERAWTTDPDR